MTNPEQAAHKYIYTYMQHGEQIENLLEETWMDLLEETWIDLQGTDRKSAGRDMHGSAGSR